MIGDRELPLLVTMTALFDFELTYSLPDILAVVAANLH